MAPAQLTSHLGYWLRLVSNHVSHSFARKLQTVDITVAEWALMRVLFGIDENPSQLAERMGMTKGAITKLADRLIAKSLMTRTASREDRRSHTLRLTKKGESLVPQLADLADQNEAECFSHLSGTDRALLERALKASVKRFGLNAIPIN
jgi:MarR family transcriptional regulator, lower aerobic nicotinate degradation pathway regulator